MSWMFATALSATFSIAADAAPTVAKADVHDPVTVVDNGNSWTLDNGIVKATINKRSGLMPSLVYHGVEMMAGGGGVWEETPQLAPQLTQTLSDRSGHQRRRARGSRHQRRHRRHGHAHTQRAGRRNVLRY